MSELMTYSQLIQTCPKWLRGGGAQTSFHVCFCRVMMTDEWFRDQMDLKKQEFPKKQFAGPTADGVFDFFWRACLYIRLATGTGVKHARLLFFHCLFYYFRPRPRDHASGGWANLRPFSYVNLPHVQAFGFWGGLKRNNLSDTMSIYPGNII